MYHKYSKMTLEKVSEQRIVAYTPPYVKTKLKDYVNQHPDMTVSKFITDEVRDKLRKLGVSHVDSGH